MRCPLPLDVSSIDFDDGRTVFTTSWKGHTAQYIRRAHAGESITGELYVVRTVGGATAGEVRLRDSDGVVARSDFLFGPGEIIENDLPKGG
jgi:hypothetical protein